MARGHPTTTSFRSMVPRWMTTATFVPHRSHQTRAGTMGRCWCTTHTNPSRTPVLRIFPLPVPTLTGLGNLHLPSALLFLLSLSYTMFFLHAVPKAGADGQQSTLSLTS